MIPGKLVRQLHQLKGIKQEIVARKMGITQQAYSKLENSSQINGDKERAVLDALQCSEKDISIIKSIAPPKIRDDKLSEIFLSHR
jgi:transcriptional regulator with XRE-family HTH domain